MPGSRDWIIFKVPSNSHHSMILCCSLWQDIFEGLKPILLVTWGGKYKPFCWLLKVDFEKTFVSTRLIPGNVCWVEQPDPLHHLRKLSLYSWPGVLVGFPTLRFHVLQATGLNSWLLPSRSLFYLPIIPNFAWLYHWVAITCHWIQELLLASPSADPALCRSTRLGNQTIQRSPFVGRQVSSTGEWELWTCQAVLYHFGFNLLLQIAET